jgi:hypothetical protein
VLYCLHSDEIRHTGKFQTIGKFDREETTWKKDIIRRWSDIIKMDPEKVR